MTRIYSRKFEALILKDFEIQKESPNHDQKIGPSVNCCILIHMFMQDTYWRNEWQTHEDFFIKKYVPLTLLKGFEKVFQGLRVGGSWRPNRTEIFWPTVLWPSTLCLSRSPDAQLEAQRPSSLLDDGFLYCILSVFSLDPKLHRGSQGPLRPGVAFLTTFRL